MRRSAFVVFFLAALAAAALAFEKTQTLSLPAEGLAKLEVTAGAGFLRVSGVEGARAVEVKAEIVVSGVADKDMDEYIKDHVELELRKAGRAAVLVGRIREHGFSFIPREARVDLTVTLPKSLAVEIDDGSGEIAVSDVAGGVRIKDGSGSIEVRNVGGGLWIDDGSGGISLTKIGGTVTVDDGSGSLDIDDVGKDVRIRHKGSGNVNITNVRGKVIR